MSIANQIAAFGQNSGNGLLQGLVAADQEKQRNRLYELQQGEVERQNRAEEDALLTRVNMAMSQARSPEEKQMIWGQAGQMAKERGAKIWPEWSPEAEAKLALYGQGSQSPQSPVGKLMADMNKLPPDHPDRASYQAAIDKAGQNNALEVLAELQAKQQLAQGQYQHQQNIREDKREAEKHDLDIREAKREEDKQRIATTKAKRQAQGLVDLTKELLADDGGLDSYSGLSGSLPTVRPSTKSYEAKLARLLSALTLENTDQLSGVLSDADLLLLQNTASAVVKGGTVEHNRGELNRILKTLEAGISGNAPVAGTGLESKTDDELLSF